MSGDNRIGIGAVNGVFRANAPRRLTSDEGRATLAPLQNYAAQESAPVTRLVGMAADMAEQGAPVDMNRVASLKAPISDGSYRIDPDKIAASLLDFFGKDRG